MKAMNYYTNKIIEMSFTPLLSFSRKRESRRRLRKSWELKSWIPCPPINDFEGRQARNDRREHIYTNKKGFTLIELVMTMVLIGIVAYVVATALTTGIKAYFMTDFRKEALDQSRIAMERMTREIRNVRSLADIGTANATQFCFVNTDGTVISFRYNANTIGRDDTLANLAACPAAAGNTLANNITAFKFKNPDGTDLTLPALTANRLVIITLTATKNTESVTLQSEVWPRNL